MGGRRKLETVGPLVLVASAVSTVAIGPSTAADLTITSARTTVAETATGDGTGPGNIVIQSNGSIDLASDAAVLINSNNTVSNLGTITNSQQSNAAGIFGLTTGNLTTTPTPLNISSSISNLGTINAPGAGVSGPLSELDAFNAGIRISGLGTFTGDVVNNRTTVEGTVTATGNINVSGGKSFGIAIDSLMTGNVVNNGSIVAAGINNYGIFTTRRITGSVINPGTITTSNKDSVGVYVGGGLSGAFSQGGAITVGLGSQLTSTNGVTLTRTEPILGLAGVWLASDVGEGVLFVGNQVTLSQELINPNLITGKATDSIVSLVGGGNALQIVQGGLANNLANINIGTLAGTNFSVRNQGNLLTVGTVSGVATSVVNISGLAQGGTIYTTTLANGFFNDGGNIQTVAVDARAVGIRIGDYATVPSIFNTGDILISTTDSTANSITGFIGTKGGDAYGVLVESLGSMPSFNNAGAIVIDARGPTSNAFGIVDRSGTLTSFVNTNIITTAIPNGSTGRTIAVDLSANTSGLSFANNGSAANITGDVLIGSGNSAATVSGKITGAITFQAGTVKSGNNTFSADAGTVTGAVSLGIGNHTVFLNNNSVVNGGINHGAGGTINLTVNNSQLAIASASPITTTQAAFTGTSTLTFNVSGSAATSANGIIQSNGTVFLAGTSKVSAAFTGIIDGQQTYTAIRANQLLLDAPLDQIATAPSSFINAASFSLSPADPNTLLLNVRRKTADELGLGPNQGAIYNAFATAVNKDVPVVTAISALQTQATFSAGLRQLMPDTSGALQQAALNNQDMAQGSIRRRLVGVAKNGMPDHASGDISSFWVQALGDYGDQKSRGEQNGFDIWGLGIAFGADMPVGNTNVGFGFAETWHSANLKVSNNSPIEFYNTQLHFYSRTQLDSLYLQAVAGGGYNSYNQERRVVIGSLNRVAKGKWDGYQYGGSLEAGYDFRWDRNQFSPYVRGAYLKVHENGYSETGAGDGVNLTVESRNVDNARASLGAAYNRYFPIYYDSYIEAEFRANYTHEFMNDPVRVTAAFASGGPSFVNAGNPRSPHRYNAGFGIAHKDSYSSVSVDYDAEYAKGYLAHTVAITARFRF